MLRKIIQFAVCAVLLVPFLSISIGNAEPEVCLYKAVTTVAQIDASSAILQGTPVCVRYVVINSQNAEGHVLVAVTTNIVGTSYGADSVIQVETFFYSNQLLAK